MLTEKLKQQQNRAMKEKFAEAIRIQIKMRSLDIRNRIAEVKDEEEKLKIFTQFVEMKKMDEDLIKRSVKEADKPPVDLESLAKSLKMTNKNQNSGKKKSAYQIKQEEKERLKKEKEEKEAKEREERQKSGETPEKVLYVDKNDAKR